MDRNIEDVDIDFSKLVYKINQAKMFIEKVTIIYESSLNKYLDELKKIENVEVIDEITYASQRMKN